MIINTLDNADFAKTAAAQVQIEKSMDILSLRKNNPALATSLSLIEEFGRNIPDVYKQNIIGSDFRTYLNENKKRAGISVLTPPKGVNPYSEISTDIDPKGDTGVAANNLNTINSMISVGTANIAARKSLATAAMAYMELPDNPDQLNMKTVEAYLNLINNPKLSIVMEEHPTFKNKILSNVDYILKNKMTPFIKDQAAALITENTRLVKGSDAIIFEGDNAAKLNRLGGLLNNTVISVSKMGTPNQDALKNMQRVMKEEVQTIMNEVRKPIADPSKTSDWFSNFLDTVSPTHTNPSAGAL
jgi:hypothetical protein